MPLPPKPHPHLPPWLSVALRVLFWLAAGVTVVAAWLGFTAARLPYNSEGRYFDAEQGVVYLEQDVEFWAVVAVACRVLAVALRWWSKRRPNSHFSP
jgi:hypothetical protein